MNETERTALQQNWVYLLENVAIEGSMLLDYLYKNGILTSHQKEEVMVQSLSKDKVAKLLEILQRKGPKAFQAFLDALRQAKQEHIADQLQQAFQPQGMEPGRMVWYLSCTVH